MIKHNVVDAGQPASRPLVCGEQVDPNLDQQSVEACYRPDGLDSDLEAVGNYDTQRWRNCASADTVLRSFNTWSFKREQPSDPALMRQIVSEAVALGAPVPFVLYWGKGPRGGLAEPDIMCLDYVAALTRRIRAVYPPGAEITLIFTDTHAELNGHSQQSMAQYFGAVSGAGRQRGFRTCRLSDLLHRAKAALNGGPEEELTSDTLRRLCICAAKWYRGDGTPEQGALKYYQLNMAEKRAVEFAFPRSIFITFNGSEFRALFPKQLPIFFMYSLRRGVSIKPWFMPAAAERSAATA